MIMHKSFLSVSALMLAMLPSSSAAAVNTLLTEAIFNSLAPNPTDPPYSYQGLIDAITSWNTANPSAQIFTSGTEVQQRHEIAAFLGHTLHESGDFVYPREISQCADLALASGTYYCQPTGWSSGDAARSDPYCSASHTSTSNPEGCDCSAVANSANGYDADKLFFGRGPIQLSWNYNYVAAGSALNVDLCAEPDRVATDSAVAWGTAIWFWMQNTGSTGVTCHDAVITNGSFGASLKTINGGLECPADASHADSVVSRLDDYCRALTALSVSNVLSLDGCDGLATSFSTCVSGNTCPNCANIGTPTPPPTSSPTRSPTKPISSPNPPSPPSASVGGGGCYPQWTSGGNYVAGSWVSDTVTTKTTTTCTAGTSGCINGSKTVNTSTKYNYQCKEGAASGWCSQSAYQPSGIYGGMAWDKSPQCDGTATAPVVTVPAAWSGSGCPVAYSTGSDYESGDSVSIYNAQLGYTSVYTCKEGPSYLWCSMAGYEPGTGSAWSQAWESVGSCTGTIAPTGSPIHVVLSAQGGCPGEYVFGEEYEELDKVSKDGVVYQCKGWPLSAHCAQAGYAPGVKVGENEYWKEAWNVLGTCSGTIAPTSSPNFVTLADLGACPDEWENKAVGNSYEEGDRVSAGGLVYQCKAWPFSGHCGQAGYKPEDGDASTSGAWKDAWTVVGYCSGSIGPTSSPSFETLTTVGACPNEWSSSEEYEEGDMVSVSVSTTPIRKVAYKCKAWPYSGHCAQFSPTVYGGDLGWTLAGSCDGSIGPTSSPSFDKLQDIGDGCPDEWSSSTTDYEAGDKVTIQVSSAPVRAIVYECREWPNNGYCNQGSGFAPGTQYGGMAWKLLGSCTGSMSPTQSPAAYSGTCEYNKCVTTESPTLRDSCVHGSSTDCTCTTTGSGTSQVTVCTKPRMVTTCSNDPVNTWSSNTDYVKNDVIRLGAQRYKCREWPNYLWCRSSAYIPEPGTDSGVWTNAWAKDGMCP